MLIDKESQIMIDFDADYPPHQRHSETSREAAKSVAPKFTKKSLELLERFKNDWPDGITDEHAQISCNIDGNSYRPMRVTLYKHGYVEDSGDRRVLKSGRRGVVWKITDSGRNKLRAEGL
jgi:hypothetical protein